MTSERIRRRIEGLLDAADAAVVALRWSEVAQQARAALAIDPENADASAYLQMAEANLAFADGSPPPDASRDQTALHEGEAHASIDVLSAAIGLERPDFTLDTDADGAVTLFFCDIEDSTATTQRLGDERWVELLRAHNRVVLREAEAHRGRVVKNLGDGFMIVFRDPADGVRCAQAVQRALDVHNERSQVPIRHRIGLHSGHPTRDGTDFFGHDVNLAARVAGAARGGEILISSRVYELVKAGDEFVLSAQEPRELRGLAGDHVLHAVAWSR